MDEPNARSSIIFSTIAKFSAFGAVLGAIKSGVIGVETGAGIGAYFLAPTIGAAFFGFIGLVAGLAKAGVHKTKVEGIANKEMGYLGQVMAAIIILGIIIFLLEYA